MVKWILGGTMLIAAAVFLLAKTGNIWIVAYITFALAFIFVLISAAYFSKTPITKKVKTITFVSLIFYFLIGASTFISANMRTEWQKSQLLKVKNYIVDSQFKIQIHQKLLEVFRSYKLQDENSHKTIGQLFDSLMYIDSLGLTRTEEIAGKDSAVYYISKLNDDEVVYLALSQKTKGADANFLNFDGRKGRVQVKGILSGKGIEYVTEN